MILASSIRQILRAAAILVSVAAVASARPQDGGCPDCWFPLRAGNQWVYRAGTKTRSIAVVSDGTGGTFVTGLDDAGSWLRTAPATLVSGETTYAQEEETGAWKLLFRFGAPKGATWEARKRAGYVEKVRVAATGLTVRTAAGTFTACTRFAISLEPANSAAGATGTGGRLAWIDFARGAGPVRFATSDGRVFALASAFVNGETLP